MNKYVENLIKNKEFHEQIECENAIEFSVTDKLKDYNIKQQSFLINGKISHKIKLYAKRGVMIEKIWVHKTNSLCESSSIIVIIVDLISKDLNQEEIIEQLNNLK